MGRHHSSRQTKSNCLVGEDYGYDVSDAILLKREEDLRRRGLASPDDGDALTFA